MLGLINTTEILLLLLFERLLKNHFMIGILDRRGVPLPDSLLFMRSIPPKRTMSLSRTRISEVKVLFRVSGGKLFCGSVMKSEFETVMFKVT